MVSLIIIATIRYEQGRWQPNRWRLLNKHLIQIADGKRNVIASNNLYDARYIQYFTGLKPLVIPNYCAYLHASYAPVRKEFLLAPIHNTELEERFLSELDTVSKRAKRDISVVALRLLYPNYVFKDLASHPGVVYIPYQVSMISLTEQYRMNIPLFFPTIDLLAKWHIEYQAVRQRTWSGFNKRKSIRSAIPGIMTWPDPNDDLDEDHVRFWLKFADFYQWPHIVYYESVEDLVYKLSHTNLRNISRHMATYNEQVRQDIKDKWSNILMRIS